MYISQGSKISTEVRGQNVMDEIPVTGTTILEYATPPDIFPTHTNNYRIQIRGIGLISWNSVRAQVGT